MARRIGSSTWRWDSIGCEGHGRCATDPLTDRSNRCDSYRIGGGDVVILQNVYVSPCRSMARLVIPTRQTTLIPDKHRRGGEAPARQKKAS